MADHTLVDRSYRSTVDNFRESSFPDSIYEITKYTYTVTASLSSDANAVNIEASQSSASVILLQHDIFSDANAVGFEMSRTPACYNPTSVRCHDDLKGKGSHRR